MNNVRSTLLIAFIFTFIAAALYGHTVSAAVVGFTDVIPGLTLYHTKVISMREERFKGMIRQHTDFSCGAAALATILHYAYGRPVDEHDVLSGLFQVSNVAIVRSRGFSLLDLKHYVETLGYRGRGYRVDLDTLSDVRIPTIILLNIHGYRHFVVLRSVSDDHYYLADPALGNRVMTRTAFAKAWNGIIFAVIGPGFDRNTALRDPIAPPSVKRFGLSPPLTDAELYEFGFTRGELF